MFRQPIDDLTPYPEYKRIAETTNSSAFEAVLTSRFRAAVLHRPARPDLTRFIEDSLSENSVLSYILNVQKTPGHPVKFSDLPGSIKPLERELAAMARCFNSMTHTEKMHIIINDNMRVKKAPVSHSFPILRCAWQLAETIPLENTQNMLEIGNGDWFFANTNFRYKLAPMTSKNLVIFMKPAEPKPSR